MNKLDGYTFEEKIYENSNSVIYKAISNDRKTPVIIKMPSKEKPTLKDEARFQLQYEVVSDFNYDGIIKMYDLLKVNNIPIIIMEYFKGSSLNKTISKRAVSLEEFLNIAIKITDTIGEIHRKNVIHMDINPGNILWNKEMQALKIIDFSISSRLSHDSQEIIVPKGLEGSVEYISPEQTGRMNRTIDYRTDYYSLGITLYELITRVKPFETDDVLEMIHSHIARVPKSPHEKNPSIPRSISDIIMKLIQKNAEDRYQSSFGINYDLRKALKDLKENGEISDFVVAQKDISKKIEIPQKLYGRENEIKTLLKGFNMVCADGNSRMLMVSGFSGIGKSALVHEIYKPIVDKRGFFISGKVEQFSGNIPYLPIIKAFGEFIRQILSKNEEQLSIWKNKILDAVGNNGQVIVNVIPQLEVIIGKQPEIPELEPVSAQNRFNMVFQNFVKALATKEHPLVVFIDDLQWADSSTSKMIELFMTYTDIKNIYFICAYRDNEINNNNSLLMLLNGINNINKNIEKINLGSLNIEDIYKLILDTLKCDIKKAKELGNVCFEKTMGNPFFINQLLKSLYWRDLISFDNNNGCWNFDLEKIKEQSITDNVVELVVSNIQKLSKETQEVLKIAAIIGHNFDLKTLAIINEKTQNKTAEELWGALKEGMILPVDNNHKYVNKDINEVVTYKFLHDKVQQAAYSLISEDTKKRLHLKAGRLLLKSAWKDNLIYELIFDITNHLNIAVDLITKREEKEQLVNLNSVAGDKARNSVAYDIAIGYYTTCINICGENGWLDNYKLMFEANLELTKLFFLIANYESMKDTGDIIIKNSNDILDNIQVNEIFIRALIAQSKMKEAVSWGIQTLKLLGINIPINPSNISVLIKFIKVKFLLHRKNAEDLLYLPEMQDEKLRSIIRLLYILELPAHVTNRNLAATIILKSVSYSYKYGNTAYSTMGYSTFGAVLTSLGFIDDGYTFGKLGLDLAYKFNSEENVVSTGFIYHNVSHVFRYHIKESIQAHKDFFNLGLEIGNFEFGGLNALMFCSRSYFSGKQLEDLKSELLVYNSLLSKIGQVSALENVKLYHQIVLNLLGESENPCVLTGEVLNESEFLSSLIDKNLRTHICDNYHNKITLYYMFYQYSEAMEYCKKSLDYFAAVKGTYSVPMFYFYESLSYLADYTNMSNGIKKKTIKKVKSNQKKLKKFALHAPMNYLHKYYLVEAEIAKVFDNASRAFEYYEKAINTAAKNEYIQEEAIASERAAIYYFSKGNERIALTYLEHAKYCYERWGAKAKVNHLIKTYGHIKYFNKKSNADVNKITKVSTLRTYKNKDAIDLISVIKASQAISEEIEYKNLISKLIKILIENAGAQKVIIIKKKNEKLIIEAEYEITNPEPTIKECEVLQNKLPLSLIKFVERTVDTLVISEACKSEFSNDKYVKETQPKSIFCMPLLHQGNLNRILYFENNLAIGAFTSEKVEMLNMLSAQMVISIENAELYQKAVMDGPTQIFNRGFLDNYLLKNVHEAHRYNRELSMLILDIDHFKNFNDTYGHQVGDLVLKNVAKNIEVIIRNSHIVARYGGEEFVVVMPQTSIEEAKIVAEKIRKYIEQTIIEYDDGNKIIQLKVTVSVGVAELEKDDNRNTFIDKADKNLYIAKETGRNRVV